MEKLTQCPLCDRNLKTPVIPDDNRIFIVSCNSCGRYGITDLMVSSDTLPEVKPLLSAIVRRRCDMTGNIHTITIDNWETLASQAPGNNDVPAKVRCLIGYIGKRSQFPGNRIPLNKNVDYPICFAANEREFLFYINYAIEAGLLFDSKGTDPTRHYCLTPKGWEETNRILTLDSPYAFVAMSFSKESQHFNLLTKAFDEAIKPAIETDAGYEKAIRIDQEQFLGDIVFEIIARIKECRFIVADVTDHRNGVYFEGGYAMGMGMPVIWTCHKDDMRKAHFDTCHLNHIEWENVNELREKLANRILATIGRGPRKKVSSLAF